MAELRMRSKGGVGTLTISQPERLNALTSEMWEAFPGALRGLADERRTRVVVIEGDGEDAFSAGADISEFAQRANDGQRRRALQPDRERSAA